MPQKQQLYLFWVLSTCLSGVEISEFLGRSVEPKNSEISRHELRRHPKKI